MMGLKELEGNEQRMSDLRESENGDDSLLPVTISVNTYASLLEDAREGADIWRDYGIEGDVSVRGIVDRLDAAVARFSLRTRELAAELQELRQRDEDPTIPELPRP